MVHFDSHIILPVLTMGSVWWLFWVRYLVDLACMMIAVKDITRLFRILFTTLLMNGAVYLASVLIIEGIFTYSHPRLDVLGLGLRPLWASLENAVRPGMGSISLTLLIVFVIAVAVNFFIQYGIAHLSFPDIDSKILKAYILFASCIAIALSVRVVYLREAKRAAFIHAIDNGLLEIKKDEKGRHIKVHVSAEFTDYKGTGLDPADVKDHEIEVYRLDNQLREVADAYAKESESGKSRKRK